MERLPDTPEAAAETCKLFKEKRCWPVQSSCFYANRERHSDECRCENCNKCKCENCLYTKKHGGYMVCLAKLSKTTRHDDKPAGPPNEYGDRFVTIFFMVGVAAVVGIMFLGVVSVWLS